MFKAEQEYDKVENTRRIANIFRFKMRGKLYFIRILR